MKKKDLEQLLHLLNAYQKEFRETWQNEFESLYKSNIQTEEYCYRILKHNIICDYLTNDCSDDMMESMKCVKDQEEH